jgi:hypothetical protein
LGAMTPRKDLVHPSDEKSSSLKNNSSDENGKDSLGQDSTRVETRESPWSPPQFSLKTLMIAVTVFCLMCSVVKGLELEWVRGFFGLAILCFLGWLMVGCVRIIRLSRRDHLLRLLRGNRKKAKVILGSPEDFTNPEDLLAAAFQFDMNGDWDAAIALYSDVAKRWPEHERYAQECISRLQEKRSRL